MKTAKELLENLNKFDENEPDPYSNPGPEVTSKGKWKVGDFVYDPIFNQFGTIVGFKDFYTERKTDVKLTNRVEISYGSFKPMTGSYGETTASKYLKDGNKYIEREIEKLQTKIDLYKQVKDNQ